MNLSIFFNLHRNRKIIHARNSSYIVLFRYFIRLKIGELTGRIYIKRFTSQVENRDDLVLSMKMMDDKIRSALDKIKVGSIFDVENRRGFENIGIGCLVSPMIFGNLMAVTQGKASFFFPTKCNKKHLLKISLLSIPKTSVVVEFENKPIHHFSISTLNDYNQILEIKPEDVVNTVSKISIASSRHWSPEYLDKSLYDFPLGVIVRSIELSVA